MKRFALLGAAGYVAPKHMAAIKELGHDLVAICDPNDSVGVIDQYFPGCEYFRAPEIFERHLVWLRDHGEPVDYVSICTPNYLHDAHCRMALRNGADAICEKPLVIAPHNLTALMRLERETGRTIHPIMQLRHHRGLMELRDNLPAGDIHAEVMYYTYRGPWYDRSWKGRHGKSGGIALNLGIHILDVLGWLFGVCLSVTQADIDSMTAEVSMTFERATAHLLLSTGCLSDGTKPRRWLDLTTESTHQRVPLDGFGDLHTASYEAAIRGAGPTLADARPAIELGAILCADRLYTLNKRENAT